MFVLDFQNDTDTIEQAFADYYRTTILSKETDPNKLHTLKAEMDQHQVYSPEQIDALVALYLGGADRDKLDPILDACVAVYVNDLDEDHLALRFRLRTANKTEIGDLRSAVSAGSETRAERFC